MTCSRAGRVTICETPSHHADDWREWSGGGTPEPPRRRPDLPRRSPRQIPPRRAPPTCQEAIRAGHHGRPPRPTALNDPSHHTRETQAEIANANQSIRPSSSHPGNALGRTRNNLPVRRRAVRYASVPLLRLSTLHCTRKRGAAEGEGAQQTERGVADAKVRRGRPSAIPRGPRATRRGLRNASPAQRNPPHLAPCEPSVTESA